MFWRIPNFSDSSPVDFILDRDNFTLEELLDEEDIIQECKALNSRLINFLRDRAQVEQLLQYIIEDSPEDADSKRALKFPFIACEIITCEVDVILQTLVEDEDLMDTLFTFLKPNRSFNSTLAGYFSKVVICLLSRKTLQLMNYIQTHAAIFRCLVDMIGVTSIMEILIRIAGADNHVYPNYIDSIQWLADSEFLEMIVNKLNYVNPPKVQSNAAEVLIVIAQSAPSALASKLSSQSFVVRILNHALEHSSSTSTLVHALSVAIALLDPKRSLVKSLIHDTRNQQHYETSIPVVPETIFAMLSKLDKLVTLLSHPSDVSKLPTTYGELHPPLGKHNLKIVEFLGVLSELGNQAVQKEIIQSGGIKRIVDLFFEYPFNNSLHHLVENFILSCLESKQIAIIDHLFCECDILRRFLEADKDPFLSTGSSMVTIPARGRKPPRVGNIGHITRICNKFVYLGSYNDQIRCYLEGSGAWIDWQVNVLHERNEVQNVYQWACGRPMTLQERTKESDEDELHDRDYDVTDLANDLSQAFRYNLYDKDDINETHKSLDQDDEDTFCDDGSPEVISSLSFAENHHSSLFTNSNWFTFEEDSNTEPISSANVDAIDDIDLGGTFNGGSISNEVVIGVSELGNLNRTQNEQLSDVIKINDEDDLSLFRFDTIENEDLFNDQALPEWVGWHDPSDILIDESPDNSLQANYTEMTISNDMVVAFEHESASSTYQESGKRVKPEETCLFEEDAEFVGADLAGGKESELEVVEGTNEEVGVMTRNFILQIPELPESNDGARVVDFDKNMWRVEPEMGVVQE